MFTFLRINVTGNHLSFKLVEGKKFVESKKDEEFNEVALRVLEISEKRMLL